MIFSYIEPPTAVRWLSAGILRVVKRSVTSRAAGWFMVISRRAGRRWTRVRGDQSNVESAVNPTAALRPEEFWYHLKQQTSFNKLHGTHR